MNGFDPRQYDDQQAEKRRLARESNTSALPTPEIDESFAYKLQKPFYDAGFLNNDPDHKETLGDFAKNMALAPSALLGVGLDMVTSPIDTGKKLVPAILHGFFTDPFNKEVYEKRPYSNTLNTALNATVVFGLAKNLLLSGARVAALDAARIAALKAGATEALVEGAFKQTRIPILLKTQSGRVLSNAMSESAKLGSAAPFETGLRTVLKNTGLTDEVINVIAKDVATNNIGTWLTENATKLSILDKGINPLSIFGKDSMVGKKIQETVFGETEKSAVGKLYGSDAVKQDMKGFGMTEEWASMQVIEKGLPDTIPNRIRAIQDWVENNPEYASLSALDRNKHLADYARTDMIRRNFSKANGGEYILTKRLPTHYTESMIDFVNKLPKELSNTKVVEELTSAFGRDFAIHWEGIKQKFGSKIEVGDRSMLKSVIEDLSNDTIPVNFSKTTIAEKKFLDQLEGSGYRIGRQPNKAISQASEMTGRFGNTEIQVGITSAQKLNPNPLVVEKMATGEKLFTEGKVDTGLKKLQEVTESTKGELLGVLDDGATEISVLETGTHGLYFGTPEPSYWLKGVTNNIKQTLSSFATFAKNNAQESFITAERLIKGSKEGSWGMFFNFKKKLTNEDILKIEKIANEKGIGMTLNQKTGESISYNIKEFDSLTPSQFQKISTAVGKILKAEGFELTSGLDRYKIGVYTEANYDELIKGGTGGGTLRGGVQPTGGVFAGGKTSSGEFPGGISPKESLIVERTILGRLIDKLGLSPEGTPIGFQSFAFQESFTNNLFNTLGKNKTFLVGNGSKMPVELLYGWLDRARKVMTSTHPESTKFAVSDLRKGDLIKFGIVEKDAIILDKILRESVVTSPSVVGLGEALSNFLKTQNNPISKTYDNMLRWQSKGRFKWNPMFGLQSAAESVVWGSLWAKSIDPLLTLRGGEFLVKNVNRLGSLFKNLKTPIINTNRITTMADESRFIDEIFGENMKQLQDSSAPSELLYRGVNELETAALIDQTKTGMAWVKQKFGFDKKLQDSNIISGLIRFSNVKVGTNMMNAYARRFGMTFEEALSSKMVNGKKVYDNAWMVQNMKEAAIATFGYKPGVLTSPLIKTINTIWFPARFQTKTIMQTADWLGNLHPTTRAMVMNNWMQTAAWLTTEEGQEWKNGNRGLGSNIFNYAFAFEGIGKSVDAVTRGKLFGGNTGLIGGLPFGFIYTLARDFGYISQDEQINQKTGEPFDRKVVEDSASFTGFVTAVENIILTMIPAMPFSQVTGGILTTSVRQGVINTIEDILSATYSAVTTGGFEDKSEIKKSIDRGRMDVNVDFKKRFPNPINFLAPKKAEASYAPEEEIQKAQTSIENLKTQIAFRESGVSKDPYKVINKNKNGTTDYGKYQINTHKLKEKSKLFLGRLVEPKEFLNSPALQELYFEKQMEFLASRGVKSLDAFLVYHHFGYSDFSKEKLAEKIKKGQAYINNRPKLSPSIVARN